LVRRVPSINLKWLVARSGEPGLASPERYPDVVSQPKLKKSAGNATLAPVTRTGEDVEKPSSSSAIAAGCVEPGRLRRQVRHNE
jgi:hypothetical protein